MGHTYIDMRTKEEVEYQINNSIDDVIKMDTEFTFHWLYKSEVHYCYQWNKAQYTVIIPVDYNLELIPVMTISQLSELL